MRLTHRAIEALRRERGRVVALAITDRCPVGCDHCNVDAQADGETITDHALFEALIAGLAAAPELEVVTITGGEPFVERQGLALAVRRLAAAGKHVAIVTSGAWANYARVPAWIHDILARCDCVYLSTSSFHGARLDDDSFIHAAREITAAEACLVVQIVDEAGGRERAAALLNEAFGGRWDHHAEIHTIPLERQGRAAGLIAAPTGAPLRSFGACPIVGTPTLRYDGVLAACGNETVALGHGPARLRRRVGDAEQLLAALAELARDPALRILADGGLTTLARHPQIQAIADQPCGDRCGACWRALAELGQPDEPEDPALVRLAAPDGGTSP